MKKDTNDIVDPQMKRYKSEGFPEKYGLLQSNIMIRKHNNPDCIRLMEDWTKEIIGGSHRDQLSFNYCCWKNKDVIVKYLDTKIYDSEWFHWCKVHKKINKIVKARIITSSANTRSDLIERINKKRNEFRTLVNKKRIVTNTVGIY